ncbi:MAG TPA: hypothetical protein VIM73_09070, partial [Polyangiaceae bacterium]
TWSSSKRAWPVWTARASLFFAALFSYGCGGQSESANSHAVAGSSPGATGGATSTGGRDQTSGTSNGGSALGGEGIGGRAGSTSQAGSGEAGGTIVPAFPEDAQGLHPCARDDAQWLLEADFVEVRSTLVSDDGSVIFVNGFDRDAGIETIWRWGEATDTIQLLTSSSSAELHATSADGSVLLARDDAGDFLWRANDGEDEGTLVRLSYDRLPWDCVPLLSRDGESAVGCAERHAVVIQGEMEIPLTPPAGYEASRPFAINTDGSAVAGLAYSLLPDGSADEPVAAIWTRTDGEWSATALAGYRAAAISDDGRAAIVLARALDDPRRSSASRWLRDGDSVPLGDWDHAAATPDLSVAAAAEGETLKHWTESSGTTEHGKDYSQWIVTKALRLTLDGTRALVEGRALGCPSGRCATTRALWDVELGWSHHHDPLLSLSADGRILVRSANCNGRVALSRVDLEELNPEQRAAFWWR